MTLYGCKPFMYPHQRISSCEGIEDPLPSIIYSDPNLIVNTNSNCEKTIILKRIKIFKLGKFYVLSARIKDTNLFDILIIQIFT